MCFSADGHGGIFSGPTFSIIADGREIFRLLVVAGAVVHKRLNLTPRGKSQRPGGNFSGAMARPDQQR